MTLGIAVTLVAAGLTGTTLVATFACAALVAARFATFMAAIGRVSAALLGVVIALWLISHYIAPQVMILFLAP